MKENIPYGPISKTNINYLSYFTKKEPNFTLSLLLMALWHLALSAVVKIKASPLFGIVLSVRIQMYYTF